MGGKTRQFDKHKLNVIVYITRFKTYNDIKTNGQKKTSQIISNYT